MNLVTKDLVYATDYCGVKSGRDVNKFKEMNLTPLAAQKVSAPTIAESPVNIECKVTEIKELGSHHMFMAEVVSVQVSDDYMNVDCIEYVSDSDFPLISLYSTSKDYRITAPDTIYKKLHDIQYETKLLNSKYSEFNLEYNAYKLSIPKEMIQFSSAKPTLAYSLKYKQSKLKSDLLFKFDTTNSIKYDFAGLPNAQSFYLISDIDNEKPIYTSDYINYMKTGYNFDKASINRQTTVSSALAATSILGGVAGIAAGAATGGVSAAAGISLITGGISSAINIINNRIAAEADIKRKITAYQNSSTGISGVNALDLRKEYKAFDLYIREYEMSEDLKNYIYNLFREFGYQLNIVDNPHDYMYSRLYYNYIKLGKCDFTSRTKSYYAKNLDLLNEYKRISQEGYYVYHPYFYLTESGVDKYMFDFNKEYENFERSLE